MQTRSADIIDLDAYRTRRAQARAPRPAVPMPVQMPPVLMVPMMWVGVVAFFPWVQATAQAAAVGHHAP